MVSSGNHDSNQKEFAERGSEEHVVAAEDAPERDEAADVVSPSIANRHSAARAQAAIEQRPSFSEAGQYATPSTPPVKRKVKWRIGPRWWILAASSALLLTILTFAGIYLITKEPSTVDQLVILTVPSGADIKLNSKEYGHSPVKLEQVPIGTYTLEITKEGFEPIIEQITISESQPLERRLKPLPPPEAIGLPSDEQVIQFQNRSEEAFFKGHYGIPFVGSALYYALSIVAIDQNNQFARDMLERVRKVLHQTAQAAISRGDMAQAKDIYSLLLDYYGNDEETRAAAAKLESQLATRRGEVRDLVRKAEDEFRKGNLTDPARANAYYYSKQALAIEPQNAQARAVLSRVKEKFISESDQLNSRGDLDTAISRLEQASQFFPDDKQLRVKLREMTTRRASDLARASDPKARRVQGLDNYRNGDFTQAIPDLEFAVTNGQGSADVIFALARSHQKLGHLDQAAHYFRQVPPSGDESYRSSIAALGDIAMQRGDAATALEKYKEARRLGGSIIYSVEALNDKIERIEKRQREKAAEPSPLTLQVRHLHGRFGGSCKGALTVNSRGVRYDGSEHSFSWNLLGVSVRVKQKEIQINNSEKFQSTPAESERFRETLSRYQAPPDN